MIKNEDNAMRIYFPCMFMENVKDFHGENSLYKLYNIIMFCERR
jgi:hypothetical protein